MNNKSELCACYFAWLETVLEFLSNKERDTSPPNYFYNTFTDFFGPGILAITHNLVVLCNLSLHPILPSTVGSRGI